MESPKVFVSYSWSSEEHIEWVIELATALRSNGIDAILDKWDLKKGNDAFAFMEQMVSDKEVSKVIIVSDAEYARKANDRSGGVGAETQIISPEVYSKADQNKFVVVLKERDEGGQALLPAFYGSRVYIDMSDDDVFAENFEQLVRWVFDKPIHPKPRLGTRPSFIDSVTVDIGSHSKLSLAVDALRKGKTNAALLLGDYLESIIEGLDSIRLTPGETDDDEIWESIGDFIGTRNQIAEVFEITCRSGLNTELLSVIKAFLEAFSHFQYRPDGVSKYRRGDWDNYKFLMTEIFLILTTRMLKWKRFQDLDSLLSESYFVPNEQGGEGSLRPFTWFNLGLESFDHRKSRLQLNRMSLRADLLKSRCESGIIKFDEMIQADLILYLRETAVSWLQQLEFTKSWRASTLVFSGYSGATELFVRASSARFFDEMKPVLGVATLDELRSVFEAIRTAKVVVPPSDYGRINVLELANAKNIATQP